MQTSDTIILVNRFFTAIDTLKEQKAIRGLQTFTNKYDIDRRNLLKMRKDPTTYQFQASWMTYLVKDYGVSPRWLLTGEGQMFGRR